MNKEPLTGHRASTQHGAPTHTRTAFTPISRQVRRRPEGILEIKAARLGVASTALTIILLFLLPLHQSGERLRLQTAFLPKLVTN